MRHRLVVLAAVLAVAGVAACSRDKGDRPAPQPQVPVPGESTYPGTSFTALPSTDPGATGSRGTGSTGTGSTATGLATAGPVGGVRTTGGVQVGAGDASVRRAYPKGSALSARGATAWYAPTGDFALLFRIAGGKVVAIESGPASTLPLTFTDNLDQTFQHIADQKGLKFEIQLAPHLPGSLFTDVTRLQQILKNLLSNAFKFTSRGGVVVRIARSLGETGEAVSFSVTDSGIGIPLEKQKLIFEAFQQADGTTSRKYGGTGLGLTISREIARLLGGTIEVESVPGRGSTFTLLVPVSYAAPDAGYRDDAPASMAGESRAALPEDVDFTGTRVLLVDDDDRNMFAIRTVLESRGIHVLHAANGKLALDLLRSNPELDLILMDTMMPEMDGLTAMRGIRETLKMRDLPIISLTAQAMTGDREKAIEAGASDYVTKPVNPQTLLGVIHTWRRRSQDPGPVSGQRE